MPGTELMLPAFVIAPRRVDPKNALNRSPYGKSKNATGLDLNIRTTAHQYDPRTRAAGIAGQPVTIPPACASKQHPPQAGCSRKYPN